MSRRKEAAIGQVGKLTYWDADEFLARDIPHYPLIKPLLDAQGKMVIFGHEGVGKSFIAEEFGWQAGLGGDVFSVYQAVKKVRCYYIQVEVSDYWLQRRLKMLADLWGSCPNFLGHSGPGFSIKESEKDLVGLINLCGIDLVIYDPWYMMIDEGENSIEQVRPVLDTINRIGWETGVATLIIAHSRKATYDKMMKVDTGNDAISGHSALKNWAEIIGRLNGDKLTATLEWTKHRNTGSIDPLLLSRLDNGLLVPRDSSVAKTKTASARGRIVRVLSQGMASAATLAKASGLPKRDATTLLRELVTEGLLVPDGEQRGATLYTLAGNTAKE